MSEINLRDLRQTLTQKLNSEEFRTLCFDLGIDDDNLGGAGKGDKVRELVYYLNRRSQLARLINHLAETRPDIVLPAAETPLPTPPPANAGGVLAQEQLRRALRRGQLTLFVGADLPCALTGQPDRQTLADGLARVAGIPSGGTCSTASLSKPRRRN